ncbi:glycosyltransferase [Rhodobacter maris]|uniref:Poly(Glycerol-phosphate) alpha-glucosyltransferase n=1 Tax=Rhodobacter maris TaxID=446682 RepID=A0A285TDV6_9RHOB|nr:glycosyltransferase [Rhodobacter maris]SOC20405.1 poly(glycerol-phosphate) alpha-glucosyltransferase [Rhodobacter maris]
MRIVVVTGALSRRAGGLFWSVRRLSQSLAAKGVDMHVIGLRDPDTARDIAEWAPLSPIVLDTVGPARFGYAPGLEREIARLEPDLVHLHGIWQAASRATARWTANGGKVMISPRGMLDPWAMANSKLKKRVVWTAFERKNLQSAACLHALNASEAEAIRRVLLGSDITTIPNGIDVPNALPYHLLHLDQRPRLLFLGRIHPKKGLMEFLEMWAGVQPRLLRPWVLRIAGPDENRHRSDLEKRAGTLRLAETVEFIGPVHGTEKTRELSQASAFVLPSKSEGLPMAVLEAWAMGLPVLMTQACNLPEGFEAGAALDLEDSPENVFQFLEKTDLGAMGARGRTLVADKFGWDGIAQRHIDKYRQIIEGPNH